VQDLQARNADENAKPNRGRAAYAMSMPSLSIILPMFAEAIGSTLLEELIAKSFSPGLKIKNPIKLPCP
jgi:hypothetical protein